MRTRAKNQIKKPTQKLTLTATVSEPKHKIPKTVAEALRDPRWRKAMCDEINAILKNGTYVLVPPEAWQNIIGGKWVFTIKYLPNGEIDRYKARFVAKGFHQRQGQDFSETFSPVIKATTIRSVLNVAVNKSWPSRQLDVNNAFLQGTLDDEVYVAQPQGFVDQDRPHYVCKLKKALYGLRQAPRTWYQEPRKHLISLGFTNSIADTSLFTLRVGHDCAYVLVYVDDMLITGSSAKIVQTCISSLASRFSIKDMGELRYFLGIEATHTKSGLHLMQKRYIIDLLEKTNMQDAKPVSTPMSPTPKLSLNSGERLSNPTEYRRVVGSLQYLSLTRPDVAFAVNRLSQFSSCINRRNFTGKLPSVFSDISLAP